MSSDERSVLRSLGNCRPHVSTIFRLGIALSSRLWLPVAFRLLAFAFWGLDPRLENEAFLTVRLLTSSSDSMQGCTRSSWCRVVARTPVLFTPRPGRMPEGIRSLAGYVTSDAPDRCSLSVLADHRRLSYRFGDSASRGLIKDSFAFSFPRLPPYPVLPGN